MSIDPITRNLSNLEKYLNGQPDVLVAYIKHFAKVTEPVIDAELEGADAKFLTLKYKTPTASGKTARIPFNPPLTGLPEAIPRLTEMAEEAEKAIGMPKTPRVRVWGVTPGDFSQVIPFFATLFYITFAPADPTHPYAALLAPGVAVQNVIGLSTLQWVLRVIAVAHTGEALYMSTLAFKHRTGPALGLTWVLSTLLFGKPMFDRFHKNVRAARIHSLIKGQ